MGQVTGGQYSNAEFALALRRQIKLTRQAWVDDQVAQVIAEMAAGARMDGEEGR